MTPTTTFLTPGTHNIPTFGIHTNRQGKLIRQVAELAGRGMPHAVQPLGSLGSDRSFLDAAPCWTVGLGRLE